VLAGQQQEHLPGRKQDGVMAGLPDVSLVALPRCSGRSCAGETSSAASVCDSLPLLEANFTCAALAVQHAR